MVVSLLGLACVSASTPLCAGFWLMNTARCLANVFAGSVDNCEYPYIMSFDVDKQRPKLILSKAWFQSLVYFFYN